MCSFLLYVEYNKYRFCLVFFQVLNQIFYLRLFFFRLNKRDLFKISSGSKSNFPDNNNFELFSTTFCLQIFSMPRVNNCCFFPTWFNCHCLCAFVGFFLVTFSLCFLITFEISPNLSLFFCVNFKWFFLIIFTNLFLNTLSVSFFLTSSYFIFVPLSNSFLSLLFSLNYFRRLHFLSFHHCQLTFVLSFQFFFLQDEQFPYLTHLILQLIFLHRQ